MLLSPEEVRGLFAEISFLIELLHTGIPQGTAVHAWGGPESVHQDFIFGNTAVEVKSLSGRERSTVRISSEDQLESLNGNLFLRVYRLSDLRESAAAMSLNALVRQMQEILTDTDALELFEGRLGLQGYAPLPEYDEPEFSVSEIMTFRIAEPFPRLIRSRIPEGLARLSYEIRLEALIPFRCADHEVFGEG